MQFGSMLSVRGEDLIYENLTTMDANNVGFLEKKYISHFYTVYKDYLLSWWAWVSC